MSKYIRVRMPDESLWDVSAGVIAANRAESLVPYTPNHVEATRQFSDAYWATYRDDNLLLYWVRRMNWSDVAESAFPVPPKTTDEEKIEGWTRGMKWVVELPDDRYTR